MNLYNWSVFIAVVEQGSFIKAAAVLNVTQSAVSHTISKLEEECGYQLLVRSKTGIKLTANGEILLPYVRLLMNSSDSLSQEINKLKDVESGIVKVAAFHSATMLWLPEIIRRFSRKYPNINLVIKQSGDKGIYDMIMAGEVDLAIASKFAVPADISFIPLHQTRLVGITSEDFVPANGVSLTPEDFLSNNIVLPYEGYDTEMMRYMTEKEVGTSYSFRIEDDDTILAMVEQGFGISVMPAMTIKCSDRKLKEWSIDTNVTRVIGLVTVYQDYISPAASLFRKEIIEYANQNNLINI